MSDDSGKTSGGPGQEQWHEMVRSIDQFGEAVAGWVRATVNDPDNRARARELKQHLENAADKVGEAVGSSEVVDSAKDAATHAGAAVKDAGQRFGKEVGPSIADLFRSASAGLSQAASRIEKEAASSGRATTATPSQAPDDDAPDMSGMQNPPED